MGQKITLKIAGREYPLEAPSPEMEGLLRKGAKDVNNLLSGMDSRYPQQERYDKLVFVALSEAMDKISALEEKTRLEGELEELGNEVSSYLDGIDNSK